jgi:hypothetical protein
MANHRQKGFIATPKWGCKGDKMDLRCPKCNSTDLKKVSLAYEEGSFRGEAQTRIRTAVVGGGGADLIVGRASTRASHQSTLSKRLTPPVKWSYRKLIFWSALVFLAGGWLVFYVYTITKNARSVTSPALTAYVLIASIVFAFLLALVVRHNQSVYPKRFAEWDRSFICQRCSMVIYQDSRVP